MFLYQNNMITMHYKFLDNNLRTVVKFLDKLIFAPFAQPHGFLSSSRLCWKILHPAHPWYKLEKTEHYGKMMVKIA